MFITVTSTLVISIITTLISYATLVPSHGNKKDESKAEDEKIVPSVPEMIVKPSVKHDSHEKSEATETDPATEEFGRRLPVFSEEDEEGLDK